MASIVLTVESYIKGMREYDKFNPPNISTEVSSVMDELGEACTAAYQRNWREAGEELCDTLHASLRVAVTLCVVLCRCASLPSWVHAPIEYLPLVAWPTAKKHADRWFKYGCIRSQRNCRSGNHVCLSIVTEK